MTGLHLTFGLFVVVLVGIGIYFYLTTDTRRLSDYMLARRDVGAFPIAISEVASIASGWTFFAWVAVGFATGLSGLWFSLAMMLVVFCMYRFVAPAFRRQSETYDSQTVTDHLALHYRDEGFSLPIRLVATTAILVFMVCYVGAQLIAVGEAMDTGLGIDYTVAILVGGIAVALYTTLGGFAASVWTDVVQGALVFFALLALPVAAIAAAGGWWAFIDAVQDIDPLLLSMTAGLGGWELILATLAWFTFALGAIGQPHHLMRFQAIRSDALLSKAAVIALTFHTVRLTLPLFIGLAGRVLYEAVDDPEAVAMLAMVDLFPPWIAGLLLAGIIGAILSTSDSMMIVTSADLTRFYKTHLRPEASSEVIVRLGRAIVAAVAVLGIVFAAWRPGTIFDIIEFAFVGLGVTFGLPLLFLLFWKRTTSAAVFAAVLTGLGGSIANLYLLPDLFPILVWPTTVAVIVGVSLLTERKQVSDVPAR